jgi:hypothetical protein
VILLGGSFFAGLGLPAFSAGALGFLTADCSFIHDHSRRHGFVPII